MADTIEIELIPYDTVQEFNYFWRNMDLIKELLTEVKKPLIIHAKANYDTSTVNTATESTKPTNEVHNFGTPQQVYIRSDNGADTGKKIDVVGQKADGSFGQFTLTSKSASSKGYQSFTAIVAPAIVSGNFTFKLDVDGAAINAGADITVALLDTDITLAAIAAKIESAIIAIANTSETAVVDGLITITSDTNSASSAIDIKAPGAGSSLITLLTGVSAAVAGTDATTPVDCGTWNFMGFTIKNDAWAGNVIIDDDGASTTVFWTCALGATATDGIIYVPDGYKGAVLYSRPSLLAIPTTRTTDAMGFQINDFSIQMLTAYKGDTLKQIYQPINEKVRVAIKSFFKTTVVVAEYHCYIVIWEE